MEYWSGKGLAEEQLFQSSVHIQPLGTRAGADADWLWAAPPTPPPGGMATVSEWVNISSDLRRQWVSEWVYPVNMKYSSESIPPIPVKYEYIQWVHTTYSYSRWYGDSEWVSESIQAAAAAEPPASKLAFLVVVIMSITIMIIIVIKATIVIFITTMIIMVNIQQQKTLRCTPPAGHVVKNRLVVWHYGWWIYSQIPISLSLYIYIYIHI